MKKICMAVIGVVFVSAIFGVSTVKAADTMTPNDTDQLSYKQRKYYENMSGDATETEERYWHKIFDVHNPLNTLDVGAEAYAYSYREPNFMKQKGYLYGPFIKYTHRRQENKVLESWGEVFSADSTINFYRLESRLAYGTVDYQSEGTGQESGISDYVFSLRFLLGYDMNVTETTRLTPYAGLAYRYLLDDGGGGVTTTGHLGYDRESQYAYIPIGVEMITPIRNKWFFGATLEYDLFVDGTQKSHLGDAVSGYNTVTNDQNDGYGMRGSFKILKETEKLSFYFEPYARFWHIRDSEISTITYSDVAVGYGLEPDNKTTEYGFRLGISY